MNKWITSDLHFGHKNILNLCPNTRGQYADIHDMREKMINEWNSKVSHDDETFILGDFAFLPAHEAVKILQRLNGYKILIEGNHDYKLVQNVEFVSEFKEIYSYLRYNHNNNTVIMCHYPILQWDQMHRGSIHLHGHVHGAKTGMEKYRARDVGFDSTGCVVSNLDDIIADALTGEICKHH